MILRALELYNYGIFKGTHRLQFKDKGDVIGILARYEGADNRSNRGGKSTLIESIFYNLTGDSRTKKEVDLIHYGEESMHVVTIWEDDDGNKFKIKRGRDIKNNGLLEANFTDKKSEAQNEINALFGTNAKDLKLTNYFQQADIHGFMESTHGAKGEFLMRFFDNQHWKTKEKLAIADRDVIKEKLRDNDAEKKVLEASLEVDETLKSQVVDLKKEVKEKEANLKKGQTLLAEVNVSIKEFDKNKDVAREANRKLKLDNQNVSERLEELKDFSDAIDDANEKLEALVYTPLIDEVVNKLESRQTELSDIKATITSKKSILDGLKKSGNGLCPIIQESCDRIKLSKKDAEAKETELETLIARKHKLEKSISVIQDSLRAKKEFDRLHKIIADSESGIKSLGDVSEEIIKKNKILIEKNNAIITQTNQELEDKRADLEERISKVNIGIRERNKKIGELEHRIESAAEALVKINEVAERNETLRSELEDLHYIVMMFSKRGIPADEIENGFQEIEDDINYILKEMECGLSAMFLPDRELDKWEPVCSCGFVFPKGYKKNECEECEATRARQRTDEITIKIIENGREANFSNDSGGGKTIISYAIRIALALFKRRQLKTKLDVLFLDEVDSALDAYFVDQIISSITRILTKKLGFKQIFLISHRDKIKEMVPSIIQVTRKEDDSSEVEFI